MLPKTSLHRVCSALLLMFGCARETQTETSGETGLGTTASGSSTTGADVISGTASSSGAGEATSGAGSTDDSARESEGATGDSALGSDAENSDSALGSEGATSDSAHDGDSGSSSGGPRCQTDAPPPESTGDFEEVPEDEAYFIPQHVPNTLRENDLGEVWLTLYASTLREGPNGLEYYTAIRNDGDVPVCMGSVSTYFVDCTDTLVYTWGAGLYLRDYYRHDFGEGGYTACIAPGQVAMTASTEGLPPQIVLDEVWYMKHEFPGFLFYDIVQVEQPITVTDVEVVPTENGGGYYRGVYTNRTDEPLSAGNVAVFPVNRVGRPLGVATTRIETEIPAGGSVTFETSVVADLGDDFVTFP